MAINYTELSEQIQRFSKDPHNLRTNKLYVVLKKELKALGYWKNRPRGKGDISHFTPKQK